MKSRYVKRWIKFFLILTGSVIILGLVFVACALMILDDDDYRRLTAWAVKRFTGYQMIVEGPFAADLSFYPTLAAERIRFEAVPGGPTPSLKSIGDLRLKIDLKRLLLGTLVVKQLQLADATIIEHEKDDSVKADELPDIELPVLESVHLKNIRLAGSGGQIKFQINRFTLDDIQDSGPLILSGNGLLDETDFQIKGRLGAVKDLFEHDRPVPLAINLSHADLMLSVSGSIADYEELKGLNLKIAAQRLDLAQLFNILQLNFPPPGLMDFSATLSGDLDAPRVSDLKLVISKDQSVQISVQGTIPDLINGEGTRILIAIQCRDQKILKAIFPEDWAAVTELGFKGVFRKVEQGYLVEDIDALVANIKGIKLESNGWIGLRTVGTILALK